MRHPPSPVQFVTASIVDYDNGVEAANNMDGKQHSAISTPALLLLPAVVAATRPSYSLFLTKKAAR
jgi:hypothetical protein